MNFDFYHNYILQSYSCNLHYILAYLPFSVSHKPLPLPRWNHRRCKQSTIWHRVLYMAQACCERRAELTKLRIVYDASARAHSEAPSLNDCLNTGPPLQNRLWYVLVRMRFHSAALTGDSKQAFFQVRIKETERDALWFHWKKPRDDAEVETLRFTRALFGLTWELLSITWSHGKTGCLLKWKQY